MRFWLKVIARYVLALLLATLAAAFASLATIIPWVKKDSPVYGLLWMFVFVAEGAVLVPITIGLSGELSEREVQRRPFRLKSAQFRAALVFLSEAGPICAVFLWGAAPTTLVQYRPGLVSMSWLVSCVAFYFAFRIRTNAVSVPAKTQ